MTLEQLLKAFSSKHPPAVCTDSRNVHPGDVFVAVKGTAQDGHQYIDQALAQGARYVVCQAGLASQDGRKAEFVFVPDSSQAAATLAQASCGYPQSRLVNLAVTGTNGKTTVAYLVRSCVEKAGRRCGLLGTVTYDTGRRAIAADLTTPDSLAIAHMQREMVEAGCTVMVMEASSHALSQGRCEGIDFAAAAFTNLTGDHLDYHKTLDNYLDAKARLFESLSVHATAVLNRQSPQSAILARRTQARPFWYGIDADADLAAHVESMDTDGTTYRLVHEGHAITIRSPLLGLHNVSNHLAAAGLCLGAGLELEAIADGLASLTCVPGRLDRVQWDGPFSVLVDFAHTDDALQNVLTTLRPLCRGRLIVLFGCGGDRDKTKRPRMARVTESLADRVVVTSDNPRTEEPDRIITDILAGFTHPQAETLHVEPDRRAAIEWALRQAASGDVVLIAGKGHEAYQIIGREKLPFSDKAVAQEALQRWQAR
jgi:UDP-N-acetylmuramoyl-L-alanyl-D-glutamate--2,6-diaminopimelate ligase